MPVNSYHPDYTAKLVRWKKNRDAYDGEDAVKAAGQTYLIKPGGFQDEDYARYVQRANWFNGMKQTVKGFSGVIFQKDRVVEASSAVQKHLPDITLTGLSDEVVARDVLKHKLIQGRYGILLDYSEESRRPYWSGYPTENIINWAVTKIKGEYRLSMVILEEMVDDREDGYEVTTNKRIRECFLDNNLIYRIREYEYDGETENYVMRRQFTPDRRERPLDFIPFQFFGTEDLSPNVDDGPLDNLADICYAYYRHSADYEHALFLTGVPTPVITGHSLDPGERLPIGSLGAWVIPNENAKAYLLEYQGHGLQAHEKRMEVDKKEMAIVGARVLEERPETAETLGAVQLRHSGELGMLKSMANLTADGLTRVLRWHHWWNGDTENTNDEAYSYTLNTDFDVSRLSPQELQALVGVYQAGRMSDEVLFWNLKQGEMIPNERTFEEEQAAIESRAPARLPFGDMPPDDEDDAEVVAEDEGDAA